MKKSRLSALAALLVAGCDPTMSVYSVVGENEVFTGTATGNGNNGTMTVNNGQGKTCVGQLVGEPFRGGRGVLSCSDGERAEIQYQVLGLVSGYGFGTTTQGRPIKFTYGLSREESEKYIGQGPAAAAAAPNQPQTPATRSTGTGFYVSRQGYIVTNAHVIDGCTTLTVHRSGAEAVPATKVAMDKTNDLALLQAVPGPAVAMLRAGRPVRPGEQVVAFGFPLPSMVSSGGVLTTGAVNALAGLHDDIRFLQISAPIQPGNSGGPLMDMSGAVIGVTTSTLRSPATSATGALPQNVNFAIKTDVVQTFLAANGVSAEPGGGRDLSAVDVGDRARTFTVLVECKG
jgi:S1-C subfamily serine protease